MADEKKATRGRILEFALREFLSKGFQEASLRRIAKDAGVTTGSFYWHFKNKEDLFDQLVTPAVESMNRWLEGHIARNLAELDEGRRPWVDTEIDLMRDVVYPDMDRYRLLLTKAQGTRYENFLSDLVARHQRDMLNMFPLLREKGLPAKDVTENELHILLSAYTTALFEPVVHGYGLEEALRAVQLMGEFFLPGWKHLMGF